MFQRRTSRHDIVDEEHTCVPSSSCHEPSSVTTLARGSPGLRGVVDATQQSCAGNTEPPSNATCDQLALVIAAFAHSRPSRRHPGDGLHITHMCVSFDPQFTEHRGHPARGGVLHRHDQFTQRTRIFVRHENSRSMLDRCIHEHRPATVAPSSVHHATSGTSREKQHQCNDLPPLPSSGASFVHRTAHRSPT